MTERLPFFEHPENPRFVVEVSTQTVFALGEYVLDRDVGVVQAVHDLANLGIFIVENYAANNVIEITFPNGENSYRAPDIDEAFFQVKKLDIPLDQPTHQIITAMSEEYDLDPSEMFGHLVEEARKLRILYKKGAEFTLVFPDGKQALIELLRED